MLNNHPELIPLVLISAVLLVYFLATYMLYRRWRTQNYLVLTGSTGLISLIFTFFTFLRIFQNSEFGDVHSLPRSLLLILVGSIIVFAGTFQFLYPKHKQEFYKLVIFSGSIVILSIALLFLKSLLLTSLILLLSVVGYYIFFLMKYLSLMKKKNHFLLAMATHLISIVLISVYTLWSNPAVLVISLLAQSIFFIALLLAFFDRILALVNIALQHSVTDGLTGLYYKTYFIDKVSESLAAHSAVVFSDIDNFKALNDTQGHSAGDQILQLVGTIMKEVFGSKGVAGRYGGEEMVALITKPQADCRHLAEKFRSRVEEESKAIHPVTVSVGYRLYDESIADAATFIKQADIAMYEAKKAGKNRVLGYGELIKHNQVPAITTDIINEVPLPEDLIKPSDDPDASHNKIDQMLDAVEQEQPSEKTAEINTKADEVVTDQTPDAQPVQDGHEDTVNADTKLQEINDPVSAIDQADLELPDKPVITLRPAASQPAQTEKAANFNPFRRSENPFLKTELQKDQPKREAAKAGKKQTNDHSEAEEVKTLSPEETEAAIERLLEENYRNHYGDRDPYQDNSKSNEDSSSNKDVDTKKNATEDSFSNPFKKTN